MEEGKNRLMRQAVSSTKGSRFARCRLRRNGFIPPLAG